MDVATRRLAFAPVPLRALAILALILIVAIVGVLIGVGSQRRVPPPFGPAANGFIVGSSGGDIFTRDTATGVSRLLIGGVETDSESGPSPDGTLVGFTRTVGTDQYLTVANIDGTNVRRVLASPLIDAWAQWAPDSRHLGVVTRVDGRLEFHLVSTDGGPEIVADMGDLRPSQFQFRPPDGREIAVRAADRGQVDIYLMNVDGSNLRKLGLHSNGAFGFEHDLGSVGWSPSGEQMGYNVVSRDPSTGVDHFRVHVLTIATMHDVEYPAPLDPNINQAHAMWSPDGTKIIVQRFTWDQGWLAILPADGSPGVREVGPHYGAPDTEMDEAWSADGATILLRFDDQHFYEINVASGAATPVTWPLDRIPEYQRLAP